MDAHTFVECHVEKLPSLPTLYSQLSRAVEDPNASLREVGDIVRQDPSLTSRLLRLANSALYSFPRPVDSIEEALQLIGLREMRDLTLATAVIGSFPDLPGELVSVTEFWKHSLACGIASGLLAERRRDSMPERCFVGGLLHDIGRLVMYLRLPQPSREILRRCAEEDVTPCVMEARVLGFDHAELGAELLVLWGIPAPLVAMVRRHHEPLPSRSGVGDDVTVHFADFATTALGMGDSGEGCVSPLSVETTRQRVVDPDGVPALVQEVEARLEQLSPILSRGGR